MSIAICDCGEKKTVQPYSCTRTVSMLCERCRGKKITKRHLRELERKERMRIIDELFAAIAA